MALILDFNHDSGGRKYLRVEARSSFAPLTISHDSGGRNIFKAIAFDSRNNLGSENKRILNAVCDRPFRGSGSLSIRNPMA